MQRITSILPHGQRFVVATALVAFLACPLSALRAVAQEAAVPASAQTPVAVAETATPEPARGTLDRVRVSGRFTIAYRSDASPLSFRDDSGKAAGFTVELCRRVAEAVKNELRLGTLDVQWVPVTGSSGVDEVRTGAADLLCGELETLSTREQVAFSIPVFPAGVGALLRSDAPERLREVLLEGAPRNRPLWRGSAIALDQRTFAVVEGSPVAEWLAGRIGTFRIAAKVLKVGSVEEGIDRVVARDADAFFGERNVLLDAAARSSDADRLSVIERQFTVSPLALALARGDEELRLAVDRALSRLYRSEAFPVLFAEWFGKPDAATIEFYRGSGLPE